MALQGEWKSGDKATTWSLTPGDNDAELLSIQGKSGTPSNFMFKLADPSSRFFFKADIIKQDKGSNVSVGLVSNSKFKGGWGMKAMLYNGNLTNGSGALKINYGPYVKQGDTIVVEYVENEENVEMICHVNGECIGTGFQVPKDDAPFFPCCAVSGDVQLQVQTLSEAPAVPVPEPTDPFSGRYIIAEALDSSGDKFIPIADGNNAFGMCISPHQDELFNFSLKVANRLSMRRQIAAAKSQSEYILKDTGHGAFFATMENIPIMSTKMMPPPPYDEVERKLNDSMVTAWASVEMSEDRKGLTIFDNDKKPVLVCSRYEPSLGEPALTSYLSK